MSRTGKDTSFLIVSHSVTPGIAGDLRRYLLETRCREFWYITHDFHSLETRRSHIEHYCIGNLVEKRFSPDYRFLPGPLVILKDFVYTIAWMILRIRKVGVFIGLSGADTLCGILLKRITSTKHVIYYSIDFIPKRFKNAWLNRMYHRLNDYALRHSDEIWDLSPMMKEGRESIRGLRPEQLPEQRVVTRGIWADAKRYSSDEIDRTEMVFVGGLAEKMRLEVVLEAIPEILRHIPTFKFRIIGKGPCEGILKATAQRLGVESSVIFEGFVPEDRVVAEKLGRAALAVALYDREKDDFTYYADPAKIKIYMAAGLPIILTDLPHNATELADSGCATIVECEPSSVARAVIEIMSDRELLEDYRRNVAEYSSLLDWNRLLDDSLNRFRH